MNIIDQLIKNGQLIRREKSLKNGSVFVTDKTGLHLYGSTEKDCITCKAPTNRIDVCSEGHFCCQECEDDFYKKMTKHLKEMEEKYGEVDL